MTDNLKPCPFCGKKPNPNWTDESYIECTNRKCSVCGYGMSTGAWNNRPIEDELNRRIAKAKDLLNAEMGMWRSVPTGNLPDHFIQLRQVLDVLDGGGE
jgi:hypothetical protein